MGARGDEVLGHGAGAVAPPAVHGCSKEPQGMIRTVQHLQPLPSYKRVIYGKNSPPPPLPWRYGGREWGTGGGGGRGAGGGWGRLLADYRAG